MYHYILRLIPFVTLILISFACGTTKRVAQTAASIKSLKYLGGYEIPLNLKYKNTTVGGLSGIDYDAKRDLYYLISDDRSERNAARFYTAKIFFTQNGIDSIVFTGFQYMLQPGGKVYPNINQDRYKTPDPEAIRFNPGNNYLTWSSEGERIVKTQDTVLLDPSIITVEPGGKLIDKFVLPSNLKVQVTEKGPRRNSTLEGLCFADDYKTLYACVEEPLYEDGPRSDIIDNKAFIRIIKFDVAGKKSIAQYAYKLEPLAYAAIPPSEFKVNGVSEILSLGNNKLLVMERSFSTGRLPCTIKLFIADLNEATDISSVTLKDNQSFTPAKKTLVLNMDELGIYIDNIEGVSFGPNLPNGHKTLLFIADNNFAAWQRSQVLLFEVME